MTIANPNPNPNPNPNLSRGLPNLLPRLAVPFRSIKTRITLSVVAALVAGISLTTLVLVRDAERNTLSTQRDRELRESARMAGVLSHRVVELQQALGATSLLLDESALSDSEELASFIASKPVLRGLFSNVFAASSNGRMLVVADQTGVQRSALNIADRDYFRKTIAEQRAVVSEAVPSRLSAEPVVVFTSPLRNQNGVYGVLGGSLRLQSRELLDDLADDAQSGPGVLIVVTDSQGRILAHPDPSRVMRSISTEPRMAEGYADWLAAGGASGGAIEPSGLFLHQSGQALSVAGVAGPDWLVWRAVPEADILAPLKEARQKAMAWSALIVLGATLVVLTIIGRLLRPLTLLKLRAEHLFDGPNDIHVDWPEVHGEIGDLSRVLRHVSAERARLEQFNAQVMAKLGSVMSAAPLGIMFTRSNQFELVSAQACRLLGRPEDDLLGQPAATIYASADDYAALGPLVGAAFAAGLPYVGEWRFVRFGGEPFWGQLRGQPVEHGNSDAGTIWTLADITETVATRQALEWWANHDPLTGLGNRKLFEERASRLLELRPTSLPAAIVMIDLDRFKPINDTFGHAAGDAMLKTIAAAIGSRVRSTDLTARLGGDEFVLLLENCPPQAAQRIAISVNQAIAEAALHLEGQVLRVGASSGVAHLSNSIGSVADWLQVADAACYQAKAAGRGVVRTGGGQVLRVVGGGAEAGA